MFILSSRDGINCEVCAKNIVDCTCEEDFEGYHEEYKVESNRV